MTPAVWELAERCLLWCMLSDIEPYNLDNYTNRSACMAVATFRVDDFANLVRWERRYFAGLAT